MTDEALLHPLIRAGLPKARQRIKHYKEQGLITLQNGAVSLVKLAEQQIKDFAAWKKRESSKKTYQRLQQRAALVQK
ncbi:hypothetical protein [Mannheimia bovis]|uniref:Uncharacterized protein n=1 Tax=Mannheimia bovis TaxID=2770636 RepID=A0A7H1BZV9_9PAST|nr:hypothetical protein [Mannheimia bovis]QNS14264.1 hypothetical protein ICJ55_05675 [Mannheimia bovis]